MNQEFACRRDLASRPAPRRPRPEAGRGKKPDAENAKEKQREHEEKREYLRSARKTVVRSPLCRAAAQRGAFASPPAERCAHLGLRQAVLCQLHQFNGWRNAWCSIDGRAAGAAREGRSVSQSDDLVFADTPGSSTLSLLLPARLSLAFTAARSTVLSCSQSVSETSSSGLSRSRP